MPPEDTDGGDGLGRGLEQRTGCVWLPDWPVVTQRFLSNDITDEAIVVMESGRARAACSEARGRGVKVGHRRREVEMRCPGAILIERDEAAEARVFEHVLRALEEIVTSIHVHRPGLCDFPMRGPSRYFGGEEAVTEHLLECLGRLDTPLGPLRLTEVRIGVAARRYGAYLASRRATRDSAAIIEVGRTVAFLSKWPIGALVRSDVIDAATGELLIRLGVRTLGDLATLPRQAVSERFGQAAERAHDIASGLPDQAVSSASVPVELVVSHCFDEPCERIDMAMFAGRRMAEDVLGRLDSQGLSCAGIRIEVETTSGSVRSRQWRYDGMLDANGIAQRVRWQLEGWMTPSPGGARSAVRSTEEGAGLGGLDGPITSLRIVPEDLTRRKARALGLWGSNPQADDMASRVLNRVQHRLGHDAVLIGSLQGGRTAAERVHWTPWGDKPNPERPLDGAPWPGSLPAPAPAVVCSPAIPASLFDRAGRDISVSGRGEASGVPARVESEVLAFGGGRVVGWAGPWTADVRWWDPATRSRAARWQLLVEHADGSTTACVVALQSGRAGVEAVYD